MLSSILSSVLRIQKRIKIPGGSISLGVTAKSTVRSAPQRRVIR